MIITLFLPQGGNFRLQVNGRTFCHAFLTNIPKYCECAALCWSPTCVSIQDLAAVGEQLKHFELAAIGGHHDVAVVFAQELHVQHLVAVTYKLRAGGWGVGGTH